MANLSEQLVKLSAKAKQVEDSIAAARSEAKEKLEARRADVKAKAEATIDKVEADLQSAGEAASTQWAEFKAKLQADKARLKAAHERRSHSREVRRSENWAEDLEFEAVLAIDYAIGSIEQAELAVLDALAARFDAERIRAEPVGAASFN